MGRKSLTREEYEKAGKAKGIEFIGESVPQTVFDSTTWRCLHCGVVMKKTYRAVDLSSHGCLCYTDATLKEVNYRELAARYGIEWVGGEYFPHSTKTKTNWRTPAGVTFEASYHELAYTKPPVRIRDIFDAENIAWGHPA